MKAGFLWILLCTNLLCSALIQRTAAKLTARDVAEITVEAEKQAEAALDRQKEEEAQLAEMNDEHPADQTDIDMVKQFVAADPAVRDFGDGAFVATKITKEIADGLGADVEDVLEVVEGQPLAECPYTPPECDKEAKYRTYDGSCNNLENPMFGMAFTPFKRFVHSHYGNGINSLRRAKDGTALPNARVVSNEIITEGDTPHHVHTIMVMHFGQFLDHDITLTGSSTLANPPPGTSARISCGDNGCDPDYHAACKPIFYPNNDPLTNHRPCIKFVRSQQVSNIDCTIGPSEQMNGITSFIDGSGIYGSSSAEAAQLRADGFGAMKTSSHNEEVLLPQTFHPTCLGTGSTASCFLAGDIRANEQNGLTSLHTLFVREHNRIEASLRSINPGWDAERLFQETRKIVIAQLQHVVYNEFVPVVLGESQVDSYGVRLLDNGFKDDYNPTVDPSIRNSFASAAYRFGHSLIPSVVQRADADYNLSTHADLKLSEIFFRTDAMYEGNLDAFYRGMVTQRSPKADCAFSKQVTDHLFAPMPPHGAGDDLVALNTQRGRDHGLPGYIEFRKFCGLTTRTKFSSLPNIADGQRNQLKKIYSHVDDIDLFIGGMAEQRVKGAAVGPTFSCLIAKQFKALRNGDRFWYENTGQFTAEQLAEIRRTSLSKLICNNARSIDSIQPNAFLRQKGTNKVTSCQAIPGIDLENWKE